MKRKASKKGSQQEEGQQQETQQIEIPRRRKKQKTGIPPVPPVGEGSGSGAGDQPERRETRTEIITEETRRETSTEEINREVESRDPQENRPESPRSQGTEEGPHGDNTLTNTEEVQGEVVVQPEETTAIVVHSEGINFPENPVPSFAAEPSTRLGYISPYIVKELRDRTSEDEEPEGDVDPSELTGVRGRA